MLMERVGSTVIIKNVKVFFTWGFTAIWLVMAFIASYILVRDFSLLDNSSKITISLIGVLGTSLLIPFSLAQYAVITILNTPNKTITFTKRYLFKQISFMHFYKDIDKVEVVEGKDSDGDPYYRLCVTLSNADQYIIKEGHQKGILEELKSNFEDVSELRNYPRARD